MGLLLLGGMMVTYRVAHQVLVFDSIARARLLLQRLLLLVVEHNAVRVVVLNIMTASSLG